MVPDNSKVFASKKSVDDIDLIVSGEGGLVDLVNKHESEIYTAVTGILARLTALENPN